MNCQTQNISKKVWHLSFYDNTWQDENILKCLQKSKSLRIIFSPIEGVGLTSESFIDACLSVFKYLRVLDLSASCFEVLPSSIGTMKHLRWINLRKNEKNEKTPKLHSQASKSADFIP